MRRAVGRLVAHGGGGDDGGLRVVQLFQECAEGGHDRFGVVVRARRLEGRLDAPDVAIDAHVRELRHEHVRVRLGVLSAHHRQVRVDLGLEVNPVLVHGLRIAARRRCARLPRFELRLRSFLGLLVACGESGLRLGAHVVEHLGPVVHRRDVRVLVARLQALEGAERRLAHRSVEHSRNPVLVVAERRLALGDLAGVLGRLLGTQALAACHVIVVDAVAHAQRGIHRVDVSRFRLPQQLGWNVTTPHRAVGGGVELFVDAIEPLDDLERGGAVARVHQDVSVHRARVRARDGEHRTQRIHRSFSLCEYVQPVSRYH